jgi:hypothetical protein
MLHAVSLATARAASRSASLLHPPSLVRPMRPTKQAPSLRRLHRRWLGRLLPRVNATFFYNSGISVALCSAAAFVREVLRLRDRHPEALCDLDKHAGVLFRYVVKGSTAYLGLAEDSVDHDITYYRSRVRLAR